MKNSLMPDRASHLKCLMTSTSQMPQLAQAIRLVGVLLTIILQTLLCIQITLAGIYLLISMAAKVVQRCALAGSRIVHRLLGPCGAAQMAELGQSNDD